MKPKKNRRTKWTSEERERLKNLFEEFDGDSLTTIIHPNFLKPQPDRFGNQIIYFPMELI